MAAVKGRDTHPEIALRKALYHMGVRGWRCHRRNLPGKPDLAFGRWRVAVFVDGAFWHGHPSKYWQGRSGSYWDKKIAGNVSRDREVDRNLGELGWVVLRLWDFDVESDVDAAARRVAAELRQRGLFTGDEQPASSGPLGGCGGSDGARTRDLRRDRPAL